MQYIIHQMLVRGNDFQKSPRIFGDGLLGMN
jgi:hypothetical protein